MIEKTESIRTADGQMPTFITHPEEGGPHPVVVIYMDAPGIREELRDVARRIGTVGYYCMLPNMYYRDGGPSFPHAEHRTEEQSRQLRALMDALTNAHVVEDTRGLLAYADADPAAKGGPCGAIGYCMSGAYVASVAEHLPERFRASVALHGVRMHTDAEDSPHRLLDRLQGEHYFGFGERDHLVPMEEVERIREAAQAAKAPVRIEVHPDAGHGFVFPERQVYNKAEAERAWERTVALFRRQLG